MSSAAWWVHLKTGYNTGSWFAATVEDERVRLRLGDELVVDMPEALACLYPEAARLAGIVRIDHPRAPLQLLELGPLSWAMTRTVGPATLDVADVLKYIRQGWHRGQR